MKKITLLILPIALLFIPFQGKASDLLINCEKLKSKTTEYGKCLDQAVESIDRKLSLWIDNQTFTLESMAKATGRKTVIKLFKKSHKDFVSYRKNDCRWQYLAVSPAPHAAVAYKTCYVLLSHNRIEQLKQFNKKK